MKYFIVENKDSSYVLGLLGTIVIFSALVLAIKIIRIFILEYLFIGSMKTEVPMLVVNILTLVFVGAAIGWVGLAIFNINIAPLLATSALVSIILGLALQDTLGNLFAGITLQFDKPYAIGDWIETTVGGKKIVGLVEEITWRATHLLSLTDEAIVVPNRAMAQSEIVNYSPKCRPILRGQNFRLHFDEDIERVKSLLVQSVLKCKKVLNHPSPFVILTETTESWIVYRLLYYISDFGESARTADEVIILCLNDLKKSGINLAANRILVLSDQE